MGTRLATLIACAVLSTCAIAGCGGSSGNGVASKTPDQIVNAASKALARASSMHVAGSIVSSGQPLALDLSLASGKGGRGQISVGGFVIKVIAVGKTVYLYGSQSFWQHYSGAAAARLLNGKWLKSPATGQLASFAQLTNMAHMAGLLLSHGVLSKGSTSTVNGRAVIALRDTTQGGTLYVATTGTPYPIEIRRGGSGGGRIVFDRFNEPVALTPPANAIDLSQLG
jgi:hypothetical protein